MNYHKIYKFCLVFEKLAKLKKYASIEDFIYNHEDVTDEVLEKYPNINLKRTYLLSVILNDKVDYLDIHKNDLRYRDILERADFNTYFNIGNENYKTNENTADDILSLLQNYYSELLSLWYHDPDSDQKLDIPVVEKSHIAHGDITKKFWGNKSFNEKSKLEQFISQFFALLKLRLISNNIDMNMIKASVDGAEAGFSGFKIQYKSAIENVIAPILLEIDSKYGISDKNINDVEKIVHQEMYNKYQKDSVSMGNYKFHDSERENQPIQKAIGQLVELIFEFDADHDFVDKWGLDDMEYDEEKNREEKNRFSFYPEVNGKPTTPNELMEMIKNIDDVIPVKNIDVDIEHSEWEPVYNHVVIRVDENNQINPQGKPYFINYNSISSWLS